MSVIVYDWIIKLANILIVEKNLQSVFDLYIIYIPNEKYWNFSLSWDYFMCELSHVEKRLNIMEYVGLVSTVYSYSCNFILIKQIECQLIKKCVLFVILEKWCSDFIY